MILSAIGIELLLILLLVLLKGMTRMITIKNIIDATPELRQLYDACENFRSVVDNAPEGAGVAQALLVLAAALEQNSGESRGLAGDAALGFVGASDSPGIGSGNNVQLPVDAPTNMDVERKKAQTHNPGLLNPTFGNDEEEQR